MFISLGVGLIGLILIYFEFFVTGGVIGAIGGILMLVSVILFFLENANPMWTVFYIIILIMFFLTTIRLALWRLRATKKRQTLFSSQDQAGFQASMFDKDLIGKQGIVLTGLRPAGHITIDGKQYQAVSQSAFIEKGEKIIIVGGEGARLIVTTYKGK